MEELPNRHARQSRTSRPWVTLCLLVALVLGWPSVGDSFESIDIGTAIGEQRSIKLADDSVVRLNDRSELRVHFSRAARDVFLFEGRTVFKVRHQRGRPFRVHVASKTIHASGGQFEVNRFEDRAVVTVIKRTVYISDAIPYVDAGASSSRPNGIAASAGDSVVLQADSASMSPTVQDERVAATRWQQRLIFRKFTLAEIAAQFNRYNGRLKIHVKDEAAVSGVFSGVFDADSPESLLDYLAADSRFTLHRTGIDVVVDIRPGLGATLSSVDAMSLRN